MVIKVQQQYTLGDADTGVRYLFTPYEDAGQVFIQKVAPRKGGGPLEEEWEVTMTTREAQYFWRHLRRKGLERW